MLRLSMHTYNCALISRMLSGENIFAERVCNATELLEPHKSATNGSRVYLNKSIMAREGMGPSLSLLVFFRRAFGLSIRGIFFITVIPRNDPPVSQKKVNIVKGKKNSHPPNVCLSPARSTYHLVCCPKEMVT